MRHGKGKQPHRHLNSLLVKIVMMLQRLSLFCTCFQTDQGIIVFAEFYKSLAHEKMTLYQAGVNLDSKLTVLNSL